MIEIVIDELVVRGLSPGEARAAAGALESELAVLALGGDVSPRAEAFRRLPPAAGRSPAQLGAAVAESVWGAISGGGGR